MHALPDKKIRMIRVVCHNFYRASYALHGICHGRVHLCSILPDFNWQRARAVPQRQLDFLYMLVVHILVCCADVGAKMSTIFPILFIVLAAVDTTGGRLPCLLPATSILYYKNKTWNQFLLLAKATALKQQISKFYWQIQRTEASYRIYTSHWPA